MKLQKTATITLHAADKAVMQIVAERKGDGARTYVLTTGDDKKTLRGMTEVHADFAAAQKHAAKLAAQAAKLGWTRRVRPVFAAKPDAFSTLPSAPAAPTTPAASKVKK